MTKLERSNKSASKWYWCWLTTFASIWLTNVVINCINHVPWYAHIISGVILLIATFVCAKLMQHHRVKPVDYIVFACVMAVVLIVALVLALIP